jgi:hypothetical protein
MNPMTVSVGQEFRWACKAGPVTELTTQDSADPSDLIQDI